MEYNPRKLFQRLFGQGDTPEEREALAAQYASILDVGRRRRPRRCRSVSAPRDRAMLDDYLESVREIERRVQKMEANDLSHIALPDAPVGIPSNFDEQLNLMFDMIALAYQANLTRDHVVHDGGRGQQHDLQPRRRVRRVPPLSHHQNDAAKLERLAAHPDLSHAGVREVRAEAQGHAGRRRLDARPLDASVRQQHEQQQRARPLPAADGASSAAAAASSRAASTCSYPDRTPLANLLLTLLDRAGVPVETLGDSTGELAEV